MSHNPEFDSEGFATRGRGTPGLSWLMMLLAVAGASAILASVFLRRPDPLPRLDDGQSMVGKSLPKLDVEGWINGPGPTVDELEGQVIVVDAWAFWCGPCRRIAPELKRLYEEYSPRGVRFIGLTAMESDTLEQSQAFIDAVEIPWPQGYGALKPLLALRADAIPQVWIVGRDGKIVWDMRSEVPFKTALEQALGGPQS